MYTITDFCVICLENDKNLKNISSKDCEDVLNEANLKCLIFEFVTIKPDISKHTNICSDCLKKLKQYNKFKQRCVRNILRLNDYFHVLRDRNEPCSDLKVSLIDIKAVKEIQEPSDNEINTESEPVVTENIDDHSKQMCLDTNAVIDLKDECKSEWILQGEYVQNIEFEHLFKEVKVEKLQTTENNDNITEDKHNIIEGQAIVLPDDEVKFEIIDMLNGQELSDEIEIKTEANDDCNIEFQVDLTNDDTDSDCSMNEGYNSGSNSSEPIDIDTITSTTTDVPNEDKVESKRKTYTKRACCYYCKELVLKLPRHLLRRHSNEEKVVQFKSLPIKSTKRHNILAELRKKGNFFYNYECLEKNTGNLIVKRNPNNNKREAEGSNFLPCSYCLGYYSKRTLYMHVKKCFKDRQKSSLVKNLAKTLLPVNPAGSIILYREILPELRDDDIGKIVMSDKLILRFGSELALTCTQKLAGWIHVRQRMRELSRLLIEIRKINPSIEYLVEVFQIEHCATLIDAVRKLANCSETAVSDKKANMMAKLKYSIRICVGILKNWAVTNEDKEGQEHFDNYINVIGAELDNLG